MSSREEDPDVDRAWRDIVENFGERADLPIEVTDHLEVARPEPESEPTPDSHSTGVPASGWFHSEQVDGRFVPPDPPPIPRPPLPRLMAWIGVIGIPLLLLTLAITKIYVHQLLIYLMLAWAFGGFGYLVYTMPRAGDRDPYDDGSQV